MFVENCIKMKEIGPREGAHAPTAPFWIRQCILNYISFLFKCNQMLNCYVALKLVIKVSNVLVIIQSIDYFAVIVDAILWHDSCTDKKFKYWCVFYFFMGNYYFYHCMYFVTTNCSSCRCITLWLIVSSEWVMHHNGKPLQIFMEINRGNTLSSWYEFPISI